MKYLMILITMLTLISCTSKTEFGNCIGAFDDKDPTKIYKASAWNISMAILLTGLVLPPVYVIVDETFCPVGNK